MKLIYLAHPVRGDVVNNLARAKRWWKWVIDNYSDVAVVAGWVVECEILDDSNEAQRAAGLQRDVACALRCDEIWLVGGRVSEGMNIECDAMLAAGKPAYDLTSLGLDPPTVPIKVWRAGDQTFAFQTTPATPAPCGGLSGKFYADSRYEHACGGIDESALCSRLPIVDDRGWHSWDSVTCPECLKLKGTEDWHGRKPAPQPSATAPDPGMTECGVYGCRNLRRVSTQFCPSCWEGL